MADDKTKNVKRIGVGELLLPNIETGFQVFYFFLHLVFFDIPTGNHEMVAKGKLNFEYKFRKDTLKVSKPGSEKFSRLVRATDELFSFTTPINIDSSKKKTVSIAFKLFNHLVSNWVVAK